MMRTVHPPADGSGFQPMIGKTLLHRQSFDRGDPVPLVHFIASVCVAVLFLLLVATPSRAQEQRCLELGQACECSEPMDTTSTSIQDQHNFADSPPAYECNQFQGFFETSKSNITTIPERGMPAGNAVDRVVEIPSSGGSIIWLKGRMTVDNSIKRTCIRYYKQVTTDYSGVGPNNINCPSERNKIIQFQFGGTQVQLQERADGSVCTGPGTANDYNPITISNPAASFGNYNLNPRVDWGDCNTSNGWCRIEMCASGNLNQGTDINFQAKVTSLKDGVDHFANQGKLWNAGSPMKADSAGDLYHGQGQGGKGTEWISHFMQASWTTTQENWIGAAYEVEGGVGTIDPRPLPPILLEPNP